MLITLLLATLFAPIPQPKLSPPTSYTRLSNQKLQTAIITLTNANQTVDLIATVHVADKSYYKQQNSLFKTYDKVCYELIAYPHQKPTKDPNTLFSTILRAHLDLHHQLNVINYNAPNFVHADLTPKELIDIVEKQCDSPLLLALNILKELKNTNPTNQSNISLDDVSNPKLLKLKLAKQLSDTNNSTLPKSLQKLLIYERNNKAVKVAIDLLKIHKKIAIYYGAAHLPDLTHKLIKNHKFKITKISWYTAWDLDD